MPTEPLAPQDATLWCAQASDAPLQVGALCLFEAGPLLDRDGNLRIDDLRRHVEGRLGRVPRFRQRLIPVPLGQGRPVWADDDRFDITHHVRAAALPNPGGEAELRALVADIIEVPLDPGRPLWEVWVIEGVARDRVAVVPKVSHVMADGIAVLEFAVSVLDFEPDTTPASPEPWLPEAPPEPGRLIVDGLVDRTRRSVAALWTAATHLPDPRRLLGSASGLSGSGGSKSILAPGLPITRPVGSHRDFRWTSISMDDLRAVRRAEGVTLNDAVLAITAGAMRHYLDSAGTDLEGIRPRVIVPVSTHTDPGAELGNKFSMMTAALPLDMEDPLERLRMLHAEMDQHKQASQADMGPLIFALADLVPEWILGAVGPTILRHQPLVNTAVTNLPGSRDPMYLLGAHLEQLFPYVSVTGNLAVIIGVLSYEDTLGVGITVDADVVPDADVLAKGFDVAGRELIEAIGRTSPVEP